jgi:hypothetical protein
MEIYWLGLRIESSEGQQVDFEFSLTVKVDRLERAKIRHSNI